MKKRIIEIIRECGEILLSADRAALDLSTKKNKADFVTKYDVLIQQKLKDALAEIRPEAKFVGEEGTPENVFSEKGEFFIVDPIDGTTNFVKDFKHSSISVAYIVDGKIELAFVYNPYQDEMFWAESGKGAYLNDAPIKVSDIPLEKGLVLFGTSPYNKELSRKSFDMAFEYSLIASDVRRSGSAALDLCYVACGRAEMFFELMLQPWDFAAGLLIVSEAGGTLTTVDGEELSFSKASSVVAKGKC